MKDSGILSGVELGHMEHERSLGGGREGGEMEGGREREGGRGRRDGGREREGGRVGKREG